MREALNDFQRKWYSHFILRPLSPGPAFSCTSRYSLGSGSLSAHRSTVSWRADKLFRSVTHSSHPTLSPFSLFKSYLTACSGQRDVCFRIPRKRAETVP